MSYNDVRKIQIWIPECLFIDLLTGWQEKIGPPIMTNLPPLDHFLTASFALAVLGITLMSRGMGVFKMMKYC